MSNLFLNTKLGKVLKRQKPLLDPVKLFIKIGNEKDILEFVVRLNTEGEINSQLFELGVDSKGTRLEDVGGEYSAFTIEEKLSKGQPIDRITLKDSGGFYKTWKVKADRTGFVFDVDPMKDDTNLFNEWGEDIVGLMPENLRLVTRLILRRYRQETLKILTGG